MRLKMVSRMVLAVAVVILTVTAVTAQTPFKVVKDARGFAGNPTLYFGGVSGNPQMNSAVSSLVGACGWFDIYTAPSADYTLSGSSSGNDVKLTLSKREGSSYTVRASGADPRRTAKVAIDALLKQTFNVDGICATRIVFCAETSRGMKNIYICDIDGRDVKQITSFSTLCVEPNWFPDGKSIVYTIYGRSDTEVVQTTISPKMSRRLAYFPGLNAGASISPNGQNLALIMSKDRQIELYIKAVNGDAKVRLTKSIATKASPCWSPTGGTLCYVSDQTGVPQLFRVSAAGGAPSRLATIGTEAATPDWSKDNQIAYSARVGGEYTIAVIDLEIKKPSGQIFKAAGHWESPSWAPDNRHVVCSRKNGRDSALYIVDTWTGKFRLMVNLSMNVSMPNWSRLN